MFFHYRGGIFSENPLDKKGSIAPEHLHSNINITQQSPRKEHHSPPGWGKGWVDKRITSATLSLHPEIFLHKINHANNIIH